MRFKFICLLASSCGVALAMPAFAQTSPAQPAPKSSDSDAQVQEIVVTAQKRAENSQKVPLSIAAFSSDTLANRGVKTIKELTYVTPGLQIESQNGNIQPFLRGIGNSGAAVGNESSVAVYIDGVYYTSLPAGSFSLASLSQVEVLKGPQGTLYGRNASAGVIQLITRDPSHTPTVSGNLSYGNYNTFNGNIYAATGLSDNLAIDVALSGNRQVDGYGVNVVDNYRNGYNDYFTARSKLVFEPSFSTKATLTGGYSYSKSSIQGSTFPGTTQGTFTAPYVQTPILGFYNVDDNIDSFTKYKQSMVSLKLEQALPFATLTNIAAYVHTSTFGQINAGWNARPEFDVYEPGKINQFTEELQMSSLRTSAVKWVAGLFYYHTTQEYDGTAFRGTYFGPGFDQYGKQTADSYAVYGQASYEILPRLTLTGGLRYTLDRTQAKGGTVGPGGSLTAAGTIYSKADTNKPTFKAALDYHVTEAAMVYGSFSRGYKSLAYNLLPFAASHDEPEVLDDYEIGLKSDLLDHRLRVNIAGFYYQLKDPQVQLLTTGAVILSNAQSARVKGVDLDIAARVTKGLTLRVNGTYLDSKYKVYGQLDSMGNCTIGCAPSNPPDVAPAYGTGAAVPIIAGGHYLPYSPKLSGDLGLDYVVPLSSGSLTVTGDYYYNDGYYFEPDNFLHQASYGLFSGQIKYAPNTNFYMSVWGKNLNNKKYITYAGAQNGPSGYPFVPGAPRTYGVTAGFKF